MEVICKSKVGILSRVSRLWLAALAHRPILRPLAPDEIKCVITDKRMQMERKNKNIMMLLLLVVFIALLALATKYSPYRRVGCVPVCRSGWKDIGGNCFENCASRWTDQGLFCRGRNSNNQWTTRPKKAMKPQCPMDVTTAPSSSEVLSEGMSVACQGDRRVYRYTGGMLKHYPDPVVANAWNPSWSAEIRTLSTSECASIPTGPVMEMPVANSSIRGLVEGMSVSCQGDGRVYRYTSGMLRHYPDPVVANAWNPLWSAEIRTLSTSECASIPTGPVMEMPVANSSIQGLVEGMSVSCQGDGKVYRYTSGMLRHYPNPVVANAWNADWAAAIKTLSTAECSSITVGPPMEMPILLPVPISATAPCMPLCNSGWKNVGGTCFENCPQGWTDLGLMCSGKKSNGQLATRFKRSMAPKCQDTFTTPSVQPAPSTSTPSTVPAPAGDQLAPLSPSMNDGASDKTVLTDAPNGAISGVVVIGGLGVVIAGTLIAIQRKRT